MRFKVVMAIAVIGAGLACVAVLYSADAPATNNMANNNMANTTTNQQQTQQVQTQQVQVVRLRDLLGAEVINPQSQDLGKIEDLVLNADTGKIRYGILEYGGMMGVGAKYTAAPWTTLRLVFKGTKTANGTMAAHDYFVLDISKDALKNAPSFERDRWPNFADNDYVGTIDHFYSEQRAQKAQPGTMTR